jgi:cytochrome d ubiquinol oxidase subunit I
MFTAAAVSPGVSAGELIFSLSAFALVYGILLVVEVGLLAKYTRGGIAAAMPELAHNDQDASEKPDDVLAFAY